MSSISTSRDGDRIWTFQAREGTSRVKEACGEWEHQEHSRNRVQAVCKCKEKGEAGEGRQWFTPHLWGKFPNYNGNGRFRPMLEQISWAYCTINKARWFSITMWATERATGNRRSLIQGGDTHMFRRIGLNSSLNEQLSRIRLVSTKQKAEIKGIRTWRQIVLLLNKNRIDQHVLQSH